MAKVQIDASKTLREWPRMERYQNSTLRYTPPADFPAFWAERHGRPRIMRCWVTLDEVWDYRTDEYFWNYRIGVNRYQGKRQTLPTFVLCSNHEIILLRINSGEDILWPEKMYRRNGKNELPLSVPAEKKQ